MKKLIISVLGNDRPGIIAAVTRILFEQDCNIENVSLAHEGVNVVGVPKTMTETDLHRHLEDGLVPMGLHVFEKPLSQVDESQAPVESEPFVVTTKGPDRKGLVAAITAIMAAHKVNVTNLQAIFKGGDDPNANIMIYEVDIPTDANHQALRRDLREKALALSLDISIQHKMIFEAINRV